MEAIIKGILERELRDFSGTRIAGQLVLSDQLVNEVLHLGIKQVKGMTSEVAKSAQKTTTDAPSPTDGLDIKEIIDRLQINKLEYHTEKGQTVIELAAGLE